MNKRTKHGQGNKIRTLMRNGCTAHLRTILKKGLSQYEQKDIYFHITDRDNRYNHVFASQENFPTLRDGPNDLNGLFSIGL